MGFIAWKTCLPGTHNKGRRFT